MRLLDILAFGSYTILMLGIGIYFYFKKRSATNYMIGDGTIPGWVISLSIFATFVSSISYLALPGSSYLGNWNSFVFSLSIPIAAFFAVQYFVPLYREINSPSAFTFLEKRFGRWASLYASILYLLTQIIRIGTILYLMALVPNMMFGWNIPLVIIVTSLVVVIYSLLGGIRAVVWSDAIQAVVLIIGAILTVLIIRSKIPNGFTAIIESGIEENKFSLGSFSGSLNQSTFWVVLVYGICINFQNYGIDQNYIQRYMTAPSLRSAQRSAFWGALLYIPVSIIFLLIGTSLFVFYKGSNNLPLELQSFANADKVFPYFIASEMPSGITGLLLASIFAAGMSTISTSYNSVATIILTDFAYRFKKTSMQESHKFKILYSSTAIVSLAGIFVALAMINAKSVLDTWWKLASIFSGGVLGLFLLGAFSKLNNIKVAIFSVFLGLLAITSITLDTILNGDNALFHPYLSIVMGTAVIFIFGVATTSIIKKIK